MVPHVFGPKGPWWRLAPPRHWAKKLQDVQSSAPSVAEVDIDHVDPGLVKLGSINWGRSNLATMTLGGYLLFHQQRLQQLKIPTLKMVDQALSFCNAPDVDINVPS